MHLVRLLLRCFEPARARPPACLDVETEQADARPSFAALQQVQGEYETKLTEKQVQIEELQQQLKIAKTAAEATRRVTAAALAEAPDHPARVGGERVCGRDAWRRRLGKECDAGVARTQASGAPNIDVNHTRCKEDEATGTPGGSAQPSTVNVQYDTSKVPGTRASRVG